MEEDENLKELVTKTLENNGVLGKIQAQLRASVFLTLEQEFKEKDVPLVNSSMKELLGTHEGVLATALVQDFLQSLNLDFSLSVFSPESGHSALWNFPGKDTMKKDLRLDGQRDDSTPLLIELLKELNSSKVNKTEDFTKEETTLLKKHIPTLDLKSDSPRFSLNNLPVYMVGHTDNVKKDDSRESSLKSQEDNSVEKTYTSSSSPDRKEDSDNSPAGLDKQYEDTFSSMSEKGNNDQEGDEDMEKEIDEEDIDEDISDLMNSSVSLGSDHTKDQPLSQASDIPNYQEKL